MVKEKFILTVGGSRNLHNHLEGNLATAIKILHVHTILTRYSLLLVTSSETLALSGNYLSMIRD